MNSSLRNIMVTALAVLGISCGSGSSAPPDEAPPPGGSPAASSQPSGSTAVASQPVSLAGTWSGTGVDSNSDPRIGLGKTNVTWTLTQTDAGVSGTVTTLSADPLIGDGGTCNSCHRTKTGTLSGTIEGTTLTWTMSFPGGVGDPCPTCTAMLTGTASLSEIAQGSLGGQYSGADKCEGDFLAGTLTMARQP